MPRRSAHARLTLESTHTAQAGPAHAFRHTPGVAALPAAWRSLAATLAPYAPPAAAAYERAAADLEHAIRTEAEAPLSLDDAAAESGYSAEHLGRLVRDGTIPNAGRRGKPFIRRGDLPRRAAPLRQRPNPAILGASNRQIARAVVSQTNDA